MNNFSCVNCEFYKYYRSESLDGFACNWGECHLSPPNTIKNRDVGTPINEYPVVGVDDWCAMFAGVDNE